MGGVGVCGDGWEGVWKVDVMGDIHVDRGNPSEERGC